MGPRLLAHLRKDRHECPLREWLAGLSEFSFAEFGRPALERVALYAAELSLEVWERGIGFEPAPEVFATNPALRDGILAAQAGAVTCAHEDAAWRLVRDAEWHWEDEYGCTQEQRPHRERVIQAGYAICMMLSVHTWTAEEATRGRIGAAERAAIASAGPVSLAFGALSCCFDVGAAPNEYWFRRQIKDLLVRGSTPERQFVSRSEPAPSVPAE